MAIDDNTSYELTGAQVKDLANKIKAKAADNIFVGATSAIPGSKGLVPAPQAGDDTKFLSGDGTWQTVSAYSLPIASSSTLGGIKVGNNLIIDPSTGVLDATDTTYSDFTGATSSVAGTSGLVPAPAAGDDTKFLSGNGLWTTVSQYSLPIASSSTLGGIKIGNNLNIDSGTGVLDAVVPTVNDATLTIQKNGTTVDTFTANASSNKTINITVPTSAADVSALPASTKYGASLSLTINSSTYVMTGQLKDQDGNNLGTAQTIDLPLESVVVSGSYDSQTKEVVLTLQNGSTIRFSVADLVSGLQETLTPGNGINIDANNEISIDDTVVAELSDLPTKTSELQNDGSDGNSTYLEADETAYKTASIPFGQCDNTSTATAFTASVPGITELRDGVCMWLKNGVINGNSNGYTIDVNGLGAKPVYHNMGASSKDTGAFGSSYTYLFVYDSTRVAGGCWVQDRGYYENNQAYRIRPQYSQQPVTDQTGRYRLLFTSPSGDKLIPANSSNSTSETVAKTVNQRAIDPFGPILYYSSANIVAADGIPAAGGIWYAYQLYIGYSFADGNTPTMTTGSPVYLKCAPQSDGSAIIDSTTPYVQALPNTEDGKIYIYLGFAASARQLELISTHPIYYYKDSSIRIWTNPAQSGGTTYTAGNHIDITGTTISAEGYIWGDTAAPATTPASTITSAMIVDGTIQATDIATGVVPIITMTDTDPGEGSPLAANNFVAVYGDDPSNMNYSLTEAKTGATWIDGSPIYKKTINFGALPNATSKRVAHGISNLDLVIKTEGYSKDSSNIQRAVPYTHMGSSLGGSVMDIESSDIVIYTDSDRSGLTAYITLYYTKSS